MGEQSNNRDVSCYFGIIGALSWRQTFVVLMGVCVLSTDS